jgi:hypothetical protein
VAVWDELKVVLAQLHDQQPGPLMRYPGLDGDREPPFQIGLAAWAAGTAEELHQRFGDSVELTVGALPYPPDAPVRHGRPWLGSDAGDFPPLLDPQEITAELDGPAVVRSGHTLRHSLLVRNHSRQGLEIATNGQVTAVVVDPRTGEIVGGFFGAQRLPLVIFRIEPDQAERIPLLIGTASFTRRLGYTVPPGEWGVQTTIKLGSEPGDSLSRRAPVFPLTVTA